ncbi:hypothetical protein Lal_00007537 [Lupinus albus]|nr:hypothetical protein Lal_00007537 [Lupinus albus]
MVHTTSFPPLLVLVFNSECTSLPGMDEKGEDEQITVTVMQKPTTLTITSKTDETKQRNDGEDSIAASELESDKTTRGGGGKVHHWEKEKNWHMNVVIADQVKKQVQNKMIEENTVHGW